MKKFFHTFLSFVLLGLVATTLISYSKAQETPTPTSPTGPAASQLRVQLTPTQTGELTADLYGRGLVPNFDVYIVDCFPTNDGLRCTTGNPEYDGPSKLGIGSQPPVKPQVEIIDGALKKTNAQGEVRASVRSLSSNSPGHIFYGIQINPPFLTNEGRGDTLQYGTFQFDPAISPINFRADPFGRIFDSQSLEPIANVQVQILDSNRQPYNNADITDCRTGQHRKGSLITVCEDGQFNFIVPQGTYYLRLNPASHPDHLFKPNPNLHPNYTKAYSSPTESCYPKEDHKVCAKLYQPDEAFAENPPDEIERDVALEPKEAPYRSQPVSMSYRHIVNGLKTNFSGKVSHPFTKVALVVKETDGTITPVSETISADKYGFWTVVLDNSKIPADKPLTLQLTPVDLTKNQASKQSTLLSKIVGFFSSLFKKSAQAQTKEPVFQPIPRYIEGYAYDFSNKVIPGAIVKVKLYMSKATYYQTTADNNGFFIIEPKDLPIFSYYLEFSKPGVVAPVKMTTAEFAQKNSSYLQANKIDLMTAKKNNKSLLTVVNRKPTSSQSAPAGKTTVTPPTAPSQSKTSSVLVVILITLGLTSLGAALYLYFQKKKNQPPAEPPIA